MTDVAKAGGDLPPANEQRGEIGMTLEGVTYPLRPSFAAIAEMETATGKSLYELAVAAETGATSLTHAGIIVAACIRAWAKSDGDKDLAGIRAERAGALLYAETGGLLIALQAHIGPLLRLAVTGAYDARGFRKL